MRSRADTELLSGWVCILGGLYVIWDNWPNYWMLLLGILIIWAPMIIDRIPRRS